MAALYSHTTRATGTTLTAAIYNADHENHITNGIPAQLDDYSASQSQMQTVTSPGTVGGESLATSLAGELERLRYVIRTMHGGAQWYPGAALAQTLTSVAGTNTITAAAGAAYTYSTIGLVVFIPANTNTGATTINVTPSGASALGAKDIWWNGAACVGDELRASIPVALFYDGTRFHIVARGFNGPFLDTHPVVEGSADSTKKLRIEVDGLTTATTRVQTPPDYDHRVMSQTKGSDIASASTINLDTATGDLVDVTGTTTITAITLAEGKCATVRFTGALTLTHGASLVLPGAANITTAAGDFALFRGYAGGVVRCVFYTVAANSLTEASSGKYTPTLTGVVNTSGTTAFESHWTRIGSIVFVSGKATVNATTTASTTFDISLPVASNLGAEEDLNGIATTGTSSIATETARITGNTTDDRARIVFTADATGDHVYNFMFQYEVI